MPDVLAHFSHVQKAGTGWTARCPAHDDRRNSLSIAHGDRQPWLLKCHVGCGTEAIVEAAGLTMTDILTPHNGNGHARPQIVATYDYVDEQGQMLYQTVRYTPKDFRQRRPDGAGGWIWKLEGIRRVVRHLPDLKGREAIVIVEGEKDVDALRAIDIPATCNALGAGPGKWRDEYSQQIVAAGVQRVVIIPDNDEPGRQLMEDAARSCQAAGLVVKVATLPDVPDKGDVSDYLATHTKAELIELLKAAPIFQRPLRAGEAVSGSTSAPDGAPHTSLNSFISSAHQHPSWPAPLAAHAYYGLLGEIVRAIEPETEADPAAILLQTLALFDNVIGRSPHFRVGADRHALNLFVAVVGRSAKGRKGVSSGLARRIFEPVDPEWMQGCLASGLSSGEGLIWAVRDPVEKQQPVKEKGRVVDYQTVVDDAGVSDKRLMVVEPEFASTLKVMAREGNTLSPVVRLAWDGAPLRTLTKTATNRATDAHISIATHITRDELLRCLEATETANGFGNRFLWVCARRTRELPEGGRLVSLDEHAIRLREAVRFSSQAGEMRRDEQAREVWRHAYSALSAERPGLLGSMTARAEAQVMRLACLYALTDRSVVVEVPHLRAALEVWRYCYDSTAHLFGDRLGDPTADAVLFALRSAAPDGLTRTEMSNQIFGRNKSAEDIGRALALLAECRLARGEQDATGGGRPVERWFAVRLAGDEINELNELSKASQGGQFVNFVNFVGEQEREQEEL